MLKLVTFLILIFNNDCHFVEIDTFQKIRFLFSLLTSKGKEK